MGNKIEIVPVKDSDLSKFAKNAMKFHSLENVNVKNFNSGYFVGFHDCINSIVIENNEIKFDFTKIKR